MRFLAILFCCIVWVLPALADERTPEQALHAFLAESRTPQRGDVFSQAAIDGVDYARLLRGAVASQRRALAGLFRYTATGKLMGEGAVSHASILVALLQHWGDAGFASVLRPLSAPVRRAVVAALDEQIAPAVFARQFPRTYHLAARPPAA